MNVLLGRLLQEVVVSCTKNCSMNLLQIGKLRKMSLGNNVDSSNVMVNSERSRRKTMTLQLPLAALSAANVVDAKYDSDSDFDYRQKPPR